MRQLFIVQFVAHRPFEIPLQAGETPFSTDEARRWLDEQFVAHECEPLRASGKVLSADKVMAVAAAVGEAHFQTQPGWAHAFARAVLGAMGRPLVKVDLAGGSISY